MSGKSGLRTYPKHLGKPTGRGVRECQASGRLRHVQDFVDDIRQGQVAREYADLTPGFGSRHPSDVVQLGALSDPTPIHKSRPKDNENYSKQDRGISDAEIEASIREGRAPREGY